VAARLIYAREGWDSITIRRLADEIEYSQPVLYSHFANRDAIVAAVAIEGFKELTIELRKAAKKSAVQRKAMTNPAFSYLSFASEHQGTGRTPFPHYAIDEFSILASRSVTAYSRELCLSRRSSPDADPH
jgi:AcrR family transcriptional regulator